MSYDCAFPSVLVKKTRKEHNCHWCGETIEKGARAKTHSGVFEGDFFHGHLHPECYAALESNEWEGDDGTYWPGEFARGRTDSDREAPPQFAPDGTKIL